MPATAKGRAGLAANGLASKRMSDHTTSPSAAPPAPIGWQPTAARLLTENERSYCYIITSEFSYCYMITSEFSYCSINYRCKEVKGRTVLLDCNASVMSRRLRYAKRRHLRRCVVCGTQIITDHNKSGPPLYSALYEGRESGESDRFSIITNSARPGFTAPYEGGETTKKAAKAIAFPDTRCSGVRSDSNFSYSCCVPVCNVS